MATIDEWKAQREESLQATISGPPARTSNPFFGVGPITNMTSDEVERRLIRFEFESWLESNYNKVDDKGQRIGAITTGEMDRGMHRGYPADKVVLDMMREIHSYFGFSKKNCIAVGLGGGHNGFTVSILHLMNPNKKEQRVFVDTPKAETDLAQSGGFFRQSWGAQILELQKFSEKGDESRIVFSEKEGHIPSANKLEQLGIQLFVGVGHETTGATTYSDQDVKNLLEWLDLDPINHHAIIDGTSLLGAMPWSEELVQGIMAKCCLFMPFQKAIGGIAGYYAFSITPAAIALINQNMKDPAWAIPRHLKIAIPEDPAQPLSSQKTTTLGPIYDAQQDKMLGGIINTFSIIAFAETTFGLLCMKKRVGSITELNERSFINRKCVNDWVASNPLFELSVEDENRRGAAVTLLRVKDSTITNTEIHTQIIAKAKQLLSYEGITHPNGEHELGLDVARYINAFPGTPGDFRAWIGGTRPTSDITALLDNIEYAYHRAKVIVFEEQLAKEGVVFESCSNSANQRKDDPIRAYKVLIADLVGLKFNDNGKQDISEVRDHIEKKGGTFYEEPFHEGMDLKKGQIHFFYQPDLSREEEILPQTGEGQYDALIAAATFFPNASIFKEGGVRIGAGTGNMGSQTWGGGNGIGGEAPLMNTPSFNSRATAQMAIKAMLKVAPDLPIDILHNRVVAGGFDTGKNLKEFPTEKLEGKRIAVFGFGNIGREVAKIARAFGMVVAVYARPQHQKWIESEGYSYSTSPKEAATHADFISPHLGLGNQDPTTGQFANAGVIDDEVLGVMNDRAVVINYDRGELVDPEALNRALESGKVRYACVDSDIFIDSETGKLSGPMIPYRDLEQKHPGKFELLPHAAADTEHVSRVDGAKQAVDQIMQAIQYKEVVNLKGELPEGYTNRGAKTVLGVGKVSGQNLTEATAKAELPETLRELTERMTATWGAIAAIENPQRRAELIERYGSQLVLDSNRYATLMEELGLRGPYSE